MELGPFLSTLPHDWKNHLLSHSTSRKQGIQRAFEYKLKLTKLFKHQQNENNLVFAHK